MSEQKYEVTMPFDKKTRHKLRFGAKGSPDEEAGDDVVSGSIYLPKAMFPGGEKTWPSQVHVIVTVPTEIGG